MDRTQAIALAAFLSAAAALVVPTAGADRLVGEDTFEGTVNASGHDRVVDISMTRPGNLTAPAWADAVVVQVAWTEAASVDIELGLREDPCQARCSPPSLGEETGDEQATIEAPVPEDGRIHWRVSATNGTAVEEPFEGTATWHAEEPETDPEPEEAGQPTASPSTTEGGDRLSAAQWAGLAASTAGLAALARPRWRRWLGGLAVGLYHRIRDHELLESETRARIHELAGEEPGIHYGELRRRLDVGRGTLEHHLRRMLEANLLVEERAEGYRCFFRAGHLDQRRREALAVIRSESAQRIVHVVADRPGLGVRGLARAIDRSPSTVHHHLDVLRDADIVAGEEEGSGLRLSLTSLGRQVASFLPG